MAERVKELKRENRSLSGKLATSKAKNDKLRNGVKKKKQKDEAEENAYSLAMNILEDIISRN